MRCADEAGGWWLCRLVLRWMVRWTVGSALVLGAGAASAQGIESVLQPGKVIQGHAKWESDCAACHVKFDRKAQDGLCMDCHRDVRADVQGKAGYHGRIPREACRNCHTDHKGRTAQIVALDTLRFDHSLTDYRLRGAHETAACDSCHRPGKKWRDAPQTCNDCHRKDDVHKGSLGAQCADCHTEKSWKESRFDHAKTRFPLTGKHGEAVCKDCHQGQAAYTEAPTTCIGCHRKDDERPRGHKGQYGEKCESCHDSRAWKPSTFRHNTDTKYALRGLHLQVKCAACHTGPLYKTATPTACLDCHRTDDKHKGSLGRDCAACHTERGWKETVKFDHDTASFPLLGKHATAKCEACHKSPVFKDAPTECRACHKQDDRHRGTLGEQCGDCHGERDWKTVKGRFDHQRTRFPLRNAHAAPAVQCSACHRDLQSYRPTPLDCQACHRKDDKHEGQLGTQCGQCHDDRSWRVPGFDHTRTRFALVGRHLATACKDCHATPRYRDTPGTCHACHQKDDRHRLKFGERCDACHNARAWSIWDFDHGRRSSYALDGAHRRVACEACHTQPAPKGQGHAALGRNCVACHRKDDTHDGSFGARCEQCHATDSWKRIGNGAAPGSRPAASAAATGRPR